MSRQRKISKSLGKDTYVRSLPEDAFKSDSVNTFEILSGEVLYNQAEPLYRQNTVTVNLSRGGNIPGVAYPGAFIDPKTGNLHGNYEGPISGQGVNIGFLNGNRHAPFVVNRYPYQAVGNTLTESSFLTPMYKAGYDATDVLLGHFSGSRIGLYTGLNPVGGRLPGSIGIDAATEINVTAQTDALLDALVSAEVKSALIKLTASNEVQISGTNSIKADTAAFELNASNTAKINGTNSLELNGNTYKLVMYEPLVTALVTNFLTALNTALCTTGLPVAGGGGGTAKLAIPLTMDISGATTTAVKTGG